MGDLRQVLTVAASHNSVCGAGIAFRGATSPVVDGLPGVGLGFRPLQPALVGAEVAALARPRQWCRFRHAVLAAELSRCDATLSRSSGGAARHRSPSSGSAATPPPARPNYSSCQHVRRCTGIGVCLDDSAEQRTKFHSPRKQALQENVVLTWGSGCCSMKPRSKKLDET